MSEFLSETEGCDLLARLFRARGYAIARNLLFREYGVEFHIDGWDAQKRVGFEFLSSEDDDHDDLNLAEYQTLAAAEQRGELALFIIDEVEPLSAADLALQANEFLDEVDEAVRMRGLAGSGRKRAAVKKKSAAGRASAGKKKVVTKKAAAKKKVADRKVIAARPQAGKKLAKKRPVASDKKRAVKKTSKKR
jgi:hypothetical protein